MARIRGCQRGVCPRAVRAVPEGPLVGRRRHACAVRARGRAALQHPAPGTPAPGTSAPGTPAPGTPGAAAPSSVWPPSSAPSTSPSPSAATAISPRPSTRWARRRSAIRRCTPTTHGVTDAELRQLPASLVGGPLAEGAANAAEAIERLRRVYCSSIGFDLAHIFVPEEREWLRHHVEAGTFRAPTTPVEDVDLLERITEVETFEKFLHKAFPGKTRFSIEGLDVMVPILDEIIADSADAGVRHVLIGMAHRGRLNVLAHVMQQELRADPRGVQGSAGRPAVPRGPGLDRRREVPRRRPGARARGRLGARGRDLDAAQPEPPGVREPGGRRHGARRLHRHVGARLAGRGQGHHAAGADSRRRRLPRPGHRRRDAEPVAPAPLRRRRHGPHHRQQPDRLHGDGAAELLDVVRQRPGARLQDPDLPRQRRRPGSLHRGRAAHGGVPRAVQARHADRPGRLPAARPQRGRRAVVHPAGDVPDHQRAPDGARDLGQAPGRARTRDAGAGRGVCDARRWRRSNRRSRR